MTTSRAETERLLAGKRILVVEDDDRLAADLEEALEKLNAEVVGPVSDLHAAFDEIHSPRRVDAVVLDLSISSELSTPLAEELMSRSIPFVFAVRDEWADRSKSFPGFVICRKLPQIGQIARALFGAQKPSHH